jgi:antitoxin component of MazEF toxin-antitoxin module
MSERPMIIHSTLRKVGEGFALSIPEEEVKRLGLTEGQAVTIEIRAAKNLTEKRSILAEDLREAFEIEFREGQDGLGYLAGR